jgi:hypothetical protein
MAIELVTYADIKSVLDLEAATIASYPSLSVLQSSVLYAIEEYLGRELESKARSETIYIGASPTKLIQLKAIPVTSVASLVVTISTDSETYVLNDDYEITAYGLKLYSEISNCKVAITYTGGISTVPTALNRAALLQVVHEFQSKDRLGSETITTEGGTISRPPLGLLPEVRRMLNAYKHPMMWV